MNDTATNAAALRRLRLTNMAAALEARVRLCSPKERRLLDECMAELIAAQQLGRDERRLARETARAALPQSASLEDVLYPATRRLDRRAMEALRDCTWIRDHRQMLITGPSGTGLTWLACAWGNQAIRSGYRVCYRDTKQLLQAWREDDMRKVTPIQRREIDDADLLILDDWLAEPMDLEDLCRAYRLINARYGHASTLIVSMAGVSEWHPRMADPIMAEQLVSRFAVAHRFELGGPSLRQGISSTKKL